MTRRFFSGMIAAVSAAGANVKEFTKHRILRRPYQQGKIIEAQPFWLYDVVYVQFECTAPIRVRAAIQGADEDALQAFLRPRSGESMKLMGLHGVRAEHPLEFWFESSRPFTVQRLNHVMMRPGFQRIDGMIKWNDPFYRSIPESDLDNRGNRRHHRKLGPGADIGY